MYSFIGVFLILLQVLSWTEATGKVATKFLNYNNPDGKQLDGSCCDKYSWWGLGDCKTGDVCDPGFIICLGNVTESSSMEDCEFGQKTVYQLSDNANTVQFEEKIGDVNNPVVFEFDEWPGIMKLNVLAIDADGSDKYDIVDAFGYQYNKLDLVRELDTEPKTLQLSGSRSSLQLELKVFCDTNYYGKNCKVYCVPRDDEGGHFMCDPITGERNCLTGWEGVQCLTNKDDCDGNQCSYGATCKDAVNSYTCVCPVGRTGLFCEAQINECSSNPCKHGGQCKDAVGFFYCECPPGTSGDYCEIDLSECESDPCQNNATCVDEINAYLCVCQSGFTGELCEEDIDECASGPCVQAKDCIDLVGDYQCVCTAGFTGKNCEINIDECRSKPCQNDGLCLDAVNSYTCICRDGTSGKYCEVNFDECESNPCQNGGTCEDLINRYTCQCPLSYTGTLCETKILPCDSLPCQNGGSCVNQKDNFTCDCLDGFEGHECEVNINECESDPCLNGGFCMDLTGRFECRCPENTSGEMCETLLETTTIPTTEPSTLPPTEESTTEPYFEEISTVTATEDLSTEDYRTKDQTSTVLMGELSTVSSDDLQPSTADSVETTGIGIPIDDNTTTIASSSENETSPSPEVETSDGVNTTQAITSPYVENADVEFELDIASASTIDSSTEYYTEVSNLTETLTESYTETTATSVDGNITLPEMNDTMAITEATDMADNTTDVAASERTTGEPVTQELTSVELGVSPEEGSGDIVVTPDIPIADSEDDVTTDVPIEESDDDVTTDVPIEESDDDVTTDVPIEDSDDVVTTEVPIEGSDDDVTADVDGSGVLPSTRGTVLPVLTQEDTLATPTVVSVAPGSTSMSTGSDTSESSMDIDLDTTASGDLDDSLTSSPEVEAVGISESAEDIGSGDIEVFITSTQSTRLSSSKIVDYTEIGSGETDETTAREPEYSVVTSDTSLATTSARLDTSREIGDVTTEGEVGSGEIMASSSMPPTASVTDQPTGTFVDLTTLSPSVGSQKTTTYYRLTLPTFQPEISNISSTKKPIFGPPDELFGAIEENIFDPQFAGTTQPLITFPDRKRFTNSGYVPRKTRKPYIPVFTPTVTEKPSSFETTTLGEDLESAATWLYNSLSSLSPVFTTETPRETPDEGAGPPPPIPRTTTRKPSRGDLPPEADKTTVGLPPTKPRVTPAPPRTTPYPKKTITTPKPIMVKTTPKPTAIQPSLGLASIRTTVYHTVKNAYNVGKKIADTAYKKAKGLLHRTVQRLSDLWKICVKNAMKVAYAPYNYVRNIYNTSINRGTRYLRYTRSRLRKLYGSAQRAMSSYYNYLRNSYKKRYNYYYTQYYNYYRNLKNKWWNYFG